MTGLMLFVSQSYKICKIASAIVNSYHKQTPNGEIFMLGRVRLLQPSNKLHSHGRVGFPTYWHTSRKLQSLRDQLAGAVHSYGTPSHCGSFYNGKWLVSHAGGLLVCGDPSTSKPIEKSDLSKSPKTGISWEKTQTAHTSGG